ncbi:hypothetical protein GCM10023317_10670 [Actinopolymorpha pittospori]
MPVERECRFGGLPSDDHRTFDVLGEWHGTEHPDDGEPGMADHDLGRFLAWSDPVDAEPARGDVPEDDRRELPACRGEEGSGSHVCVEHVEQVGAGGEHRESAAVERVEKVVTAYVRVRVGDDRGVGDRADAFHQGACVGGQLGGLTLLWEWVDTQDVGAERGQLVEQRGLTRCRYPRDEVAATSVPGQGSTFTVRLPSSAGGTQTQAERVRRRRSPSGTS